MAPAPASGSSSRRARTVLQRLVTRLARMPVARLADHRPAMQRAMRQLVEITAAFGAGTPRSAPSLPDHLLVDGLTVVAADLIDLLDEAGDDQRMNRVLAVLDQLAQDVDSAP